MKLFGALLLTIGVAFSGTLLAQTTTTKPAAPLPACCGDSCKKMSNCCKADATGKVTCSMGGSCCLKPSTAPAAK